MVAVETMTVTVDTPVDRAPVRWWNGEFLETANVLGYWDGSSLTPLGRDI